MNLRSFSRVQILSAMAALVAAGADYPTGGTNRPELISPPRSICFTEAHRLIGVLLDRPAIVAKRIAEDFVPDGLLDESAWNEAKPVRIEMDSPNAQLRPELSTKVRALWSEAFLYLGYECPYTEITVFEPKQTKERFGLWERDVVEAFIASDRANITTYTEYEWAPNGEWLDLKLAAGKADFGWDSKMTSAVTIDRERKVWRVEVRIPMQSLGGVAPKTGRIWRINLYRHDTAHRATLAFRPTLTKTFHTPPRFAWLQFGP